MATISLIIQGNSISNAGMQPLLTVGMYPEEEMDLLDTAPTIGDSLAFKIKHRSNYIVYTLTDTKVHPIGSSREGRLVISIAVPKSQELKDGKSPYKLLTEIYNKFVSENMQAASDGSHTFKSNEPDKEVYKAILDTYPTDSRTTPYITMSPTGETGIVQADTDEKLVELFRDSQYPEFRTYKEIEIGRTCASTVRIDIPRRREYKVMLNGMNVKTLKSYTEKFNSEDYLRDSEYNTYIGQHVEFTLQELIADEDGSMFDGRVKLNGDTIECTVKEKAKEFLLKAEIKAQSGTLSEEDRDNVVQLLKNGKIRVKFGNDEISRAFYTYDDILVRGADIKSQVYLSPESYGDYTFTVEKRKEQKKIILFVKKNKKPEPKQESAYDRPSTGGGKKDKGSYPPVPIQKAAGLELRLVSNNPINSGDYVAEVSTQYPEDKDRRHLCQVLSFKRQKDGPRNIATLILDNDWADRSGISVVIKRDDQTSGKPQWKKTKPHNVYIQNGVAEIDFTDWEFKQDDYKINSKLMNLLIGLGAGLVIGGALCFLFMQNPEGNRLSSEQQEKIESLQKEILNLQQENNGLKNEIADLKKPQDTQDPSDVPGNPEGQASSADSNNNQPQTNEQPPAVDYRSQIVEAVNNRQWTKLEGKNGLLAKAVKAKQITTKQKDKITSFWWKNDRSLKKSEVALIEEKLVGKQFKTIDEIVEFAETIPSILK